MGRGVGMGGEQRSTVSPSAPDVAPFAAPDDGAETASPNLVVVINPSTRRFAPNDLRATLQRELGDTHTLHFLETDPERDTTAAVRELVAGSAAILACGGDGTVNAVAAALVGQPTPLAIFPGGTTNIIAQGLGIPAICRRSASACAATP